MEQSKLPSAAEVGNIVFVSEVAAQLKTIGGPGQMMSALQIWEKISPNQKMNNLADFGMFLLQNHLALGLDRFKKKRKNVYRLFAAAPVDLERQMVGLAVQLGKENTPSAQDLHQGQQSRIKYLLEKFQGDHTLFLVAHPELQQDDSALDAVELNFLRLVRWMPPPFSLRRAFEILLGRDLIDEKDDQLEQTLRQWPGSFYFSVDKNGQLGLRKGYKDTYVALSKMGSHFSISGLKPQNGLLSSSSPTPLPSAVAQPAALVIAPAVSESLAVSRAPTQSQQTQQVIVSNSNQIINGAAGGLRLGVKPIEIVSSHSRASQIVSTLISAKVGMVAIDCEGIDLGINGKLCLIQLTAKGHPIFLFSLVEAPDMIEALKPLLEHSEIEKVLHDCRQDCSALEALGIRLRPLNDTQKMYDLLQELTSRVDNGGGETWTSVVTNEKRIGLNQLLVAFKFKPNPYKQQMKNQHDKWNQPIASLSRQMIEYAAWDVFELLELRDRLQENINRQMALAVVISSEEYAASASGSPAAFIPGSASTFDSLRPPPVGRDGTSSGPVFEIRFDEERKGEPMRFAFRETAEEQSGTSESSRADHFEPVSSEVLSIISILPEEYKDHMIEKLNEHPTDPMVEFVVDLGRVPTMRLKSGRKIRFVEIARPMDLIPFLQPLLAFKLSESRRQLDVDATADVEVQLNKFFSSDNRLGIRGSLHRISCKRNRIGGIDGLTYRIGRHAPGCASIIQDTIASLAAPADDISAERKSLLLMGKPGTGKTTLLREVAFRLSGEELDQSVMIVDSSNEIGGDSEIPHEAVGFSRRMEVPDRAKQHQQMIEAVQNHSPDIIIIDEIGTTPEVQAAQTIAHRGVSLIATAHGGSLAAAVRNNTLKPLLGGIDTVILSAKEAEKDTTGQKGKHRTVRKEPPTFSTLIEILKPGYVRIYHTLSDAVDMYLEGRAILVEERWLSTTPTGQKIFGKFAFVTPGALKGDMDTVKAAGEAVAAVFENEK